MWVGQEAEGYPFVVSSLPNSLEDQLNGPAQFFEVRNGTVHMRHHARLR
jgi:hypothetical protein